MRSKVTLIVTTALVLGACQARQPAIVPGPSRAVPTPVSPTSTPVPALTTFQLRNAEYCGLIIADCVVMKDGAAVKNGTALHMLDLQASGDLDGDGVADAAVLIHEEYGGSDNTDLVAVLNRGGQPAETRSIPLGAGTSVDGLGIQDGAITVEAGIKGAVGDSGYASTRATWTYILPTARIKGLTQIRVSTAASEGPERTLTIESPAKGAMVPDKFEVTGKFTASPYDDKLYYEVYDASGNSVYNSRAIPAGIDGSNFNLLVDLSFAPAGELRLEIENSYSTQQVFMPLAADSVVVDHQPENSSQPALFFDSFHMADDQRGWAWKDGNQLFRTDDGGSMWTSVELNGKMQTSGAYFLDGEQAWLSGIADASGAQPIYHTGDGGHSWTQLAQLQGPDLSLYFHDPEIGWALTGTAAAGNMFYQAYQTTDGGQTWSLMKATSPGGTEKGLPPATIHVASGDSVRFMPPETIWIASGFGISTSYARLTVSRNGGRSWSDMNLALPSAIVKGEPPVTAAAPQFVSNQEGYLPVTAGDKLVFFVTKDSGRTWQLQTPVLATNSMYPRAQFVSTLDGFAICGASLCATHDGAKAWQSMPTDFAFGYSQGGSYVSEFEFVDPERGWAILVDGYDHTSMLETTDGGHTWHTIEPLLK